MRSTWDRKAAIALGVAITAVLGCSRAQVTAPETSRVSSSAADRAFVDTLERNTFNWFWETTDAQTGLTPDRWPSRTFSSIAAIGFGLTAYVVGAERAYVPREASANRTLATLRYLWERPQGTEPTGTAGYRGFYYHFLTFDSGTRFKNVELSTIDTALLMAGVLTCRQYFTGSDAAESAIRAYADSLYRRVDWKWALTSDGTISMGWKPDSGLGTQWTWRGYDESMVLYILALGSPTHPIDASAWPAFTSTYKWDQFHGQQYVQFGPLFGHEYSEVWIDVRGIQDAYMRGKGIDYFENSRRATLAQRQYAIDNPGGWRRYGPDLWGVTASDGPGDTTLLIAGRRRRFIGYGGRGAGTMGILDDGTIAPTGLGGAVPFAPEITLPTLRAIRVNDGDRVFGRYGFVDALNPTFDVDVRPEGGRVIPGHGWYDSDYLGIDQGPILAMAENWRSGLLWRLMRGDPDVVRGLCRAGFAGGWIAGRC